MLQRSGSKAAGPICGPEAAMSKQSRKGRVVVGAIVVGGLVLGGLALLACSVSAQGEKDLGQLLKQSGLKYQALEDDAGWAVQMDTGGAEPTTVLLTYGDKEKTFALIFSTVVDKDDKFDYGKELLVECMKLNNDINYCKLCLDFDNGDIDCQGEQYMSVLTSDLLVKYIKVVAATAAENRENLNNLAK